MSELRIECPHCKTTYTAERCGLALTPEQTAAVTIACGLCGEQFEVLIAPKTVVETKPQGWVDWALRRPAAVVERVDGHVAKSFKRE